MPNVLEGPVSYRSQLVRRFVSSGVQPRAGVCVPLHSEGADEGQLLPLCRAVAPELDVCAPQAPRSRNPLLSSGNSRGWSAYRGYSWYRSDGPRPEPASFGDSLWQLDQFTLDLREARASENPPILLLGYREGACLALVTAVVAPERFEGVVAIAGLLPELPGWELPATELHGLPVLLMLESEAPPLSSRRTIAELTRRGGAVQVAWVRGVDRLPERATPLVAAWIQSRHSRRRAPALASPEEASYGSE